MRPLLIFAVVLAAACHREPDLPLSYRLQGGKTLAARTAGDRYVVAVLAQPSDVFSCGTVISNWVEWGRRHPGQFLLVFTRPPTLAEQRRLRLYRLHPDEVLDPRIRRLAGQPPLEMMINAGRVVVQGPLPPGLPESPLLTALERGRAPALLHESGAAVRPPPDASHPTFVEESAT